MLYTSKMAQQATKGVLVTNQFRSWLENNDTILRFLCKHLFKFYKELSQNVCAYTFKNGQFLEDFQGFVMSFTYSLKMGGGVGFEMNEL